jgi:hypothetical protein
MKKKKKKKMATEQPRLARRLKRIERDRLIARWLAETPPPGQCECWSCHSLRVDDLSPCPHCGAESE